MCPRLAIPAVIAVVAALSTSTVAAARANSTGTTAEIARVQTVVDAVKARLELAHEVSVEVVTDNPLMVSVDPTERGEAFRMSFEQAFLDELTDGELEAVVAHELGHVWIYTHHPYLQTEQLANQIAMRVVDRAVLERVYQKVWARGARPGDVERFADR